MKPAHSSDVLSAQPVGKTGNRRPEEAFAHPRGRLRRILHVTTLAGYGARGSPKLAFVRIRTRLHGLGENSASFALRRGRRPVCPAERSSASVGRLPAVSPRT